MTTERPDHWPTSHEWTRALINAERAGKLTHGACNFGLRLAVAIQWSPGSKGDITKPGLYWSRNEIQKAVGISRNTWTRNMRELVKAGFLWNYKGNYLVRVPKEWHYRLDDMPLTPAHQSGA